jgi:hypothetical protein
MSTDYRRLFERYHKCCLLPGTDIHHINGNHKNNNIDNLQAVSLLEHYNIHKQQNDYYACFMISQRMKIKPDDWKQMAIKNGRKSAIKNRDNGIGLLAWVKNNPELAQQIRSENGKKSGKIAAEQKLGIHALTAEEKRLIASLGGKKAADLGLGFKAGHASKAGKLGGKKGGAYAKKYRTGIFALTPEQNRQRIMNMQSTWAIKLGKASAWPKKEIS